MGADRTASGVVGRRVAFSSTIALSTAVPPATLRQACPSAVCRRGARSRQGALLLVQIRPARPTARAPRKRPPRIGSRAGRVRSAIKLNMPGIVLPLRSRPRHFPHTASMSASPPTSDRSSHRKSQARCSAGYALLMSAPIPKPVRPKALRQLNVEARRNRHRPLLAAGVAIHGQHARA